jgi:hypothetical protein
MKNEPSFSKLIKSGGIQLFLAIAGVAVALLNVWLASSIAPISERVTSLAVWAEDHENTQERQIVPRLDRIENKLDQLIKEVR